MVEYAVIRKQLQLLLWGAGNLPYAESPESLQTDFAHHRLPCTFTLPCTNALKKTQIKPQQTVEEVKM